MIAFQDFLAEQLKDPAFAAEYEALAPERERLRAALRASLRAGSEAEAAEEVI